MTQALKNHDEIPVLCAGKCGLEVTFRELRNAKRQRMKGGSIFSWRRLIGKIRSIDEGIGRSWTGHERLTRSRAISGVGWATERPSITLISKNPKKRLPN